MFLFNKLGFTFYLFNISKRDHTSTKMPKKKITSKFEHNFNKHYIKCSDLKEEEETNYEEKCSRGFETLRDENGETIKDENGKEVQVEKFKICCQKDLPKGFYRKTWKLHYEWAPRVFRKIDEEQPEEPTLPVFSIETTELLNSEPYKGFTPCPSFFEGVEEGVEEEKKTFFKGEITEKIKIRFHECRCKFKHCLLRNPFPTYHPISGVITSVTNQTCVKSMCTNIREEKCNQKSKKSASPYPKHKRNFRQIVLWEERHLESLEKDGNGIPVVKKRHLGRIVACVNHWPPKEQIHFWKHGHLSDEAVLKALPETQELHPARTKFRTGFSGHQVSRQALLEEFMLPAPNPDISKRALYPTYIFVPEKIVETIEIVPGLSTLVISNSNEIIPEIISTSNEKIPRPSTSSSISNKVLPGTSASTSHSTLSKLIVPIPKFSNLSDEDIKSCIPENITLQDSEEFYQSSDELSLPDQDFEELFSPEPLPLFNEIGLNSKKNSDDVALNSKADSGEVALKLKEDFNISYPLLDIGFKLLDAGVKELELIINPPKKLRSKFEISDDQLTKLVQLIQNGQSEFQMIATVNHDHEEMPLYVISICWTEQSKLKVFFLRKKGDTILRTKCFLDQLKTNIFQEFNNRGQLEGFGPVTECDSVQMETLRQGISLQAAGLAEFASEETNKNKTSSLIANLYKRKHKSAKITLLEQKKKILLLLNKLNSKTKR